LPGSRAFVVVRTCLTCHPSVSGASRAFFSRPTNSIAHRRLVAALAPSRRHRRSGLLPDAQSRPPAIMPTWRDAATRMGSAPLPKLTGATPGAINARFRWDGHLFHQGRLWPVVMDEPHLFGAARSNNSTHIRCLAGWRALPQTGRVDHSGASSRARIRARTVGAGCAH